ncbi:pyridoxal-phosphate dependent enzyme [Aquimarina sp. ERC-38]|uniref:pyridoxal-phosphate dependent enzyme n=1 Tax=Aquimarina sp. ERC-38 TaxID=2949996 RepID=UPI0022458C8D|nr:pyridoxal-phosphate dependent enzyme [Aquimarina sp. ERC-38]UZO79480.1 pyridoxal-phosphate dependent enzyme [Aquimarina sp. ERC-38]
MVKDYKQLLTNTRANISKFIHHTPVLTSSALNKIAGTSLYFKCENFQRMGAFKMRGAINAVFHLTEEEKKYGVVTHSSGNFAQALSLAAKTFKIPAYIVMPENAPQVKKEAVRSYGGNITECLPTQTAREHTASQIAKEKQATFIHPSNDLNVILGNATATLELLEEYSDLDVVITPVGGGGLIAGTALAAFYFGNNCMTYGGEPFAVDDAYRSLLSGKIEINSSMETIADGLKTTLGTINFPLIQKYVTDIFRVEEEEIIKAMQLIWQRMKIIIEPSCAVPFAAIVKHKEVFKNKKVGVILSGGNVDLTNLPFN